MVIAVIDRYTEKFEEALENIAREEVRNVDVHAGALR
jgi:hypothetical protein